MASINRLTAKQIVGLPKGLHGDGGNLYLSVRTGGSRQWIVRYRWLGKQREVGLGGAGPGGMPLSEARAKADTIRRDLRNGIDPIAVKAEAAKTVAVITFRTMMDEYIARAIPSWKNPKSAAQWRASLETHARLILNTPVDKIEVNDIIGVLDPIWYRLPETAKRVRGRIEAILSLSKTKRLRTGENPAAWRDNLANVFRPKPKLVRGHFDSMDFESAPGFLCELRAKDSMSAIALEWIILTTSRATVAVTAKWSEIDLANRIWTIPAGRMKGTAEAGLLTDDHVVPLSRAALDILAKVSRLRISQNPDELLFPGSTQKPLSLTSLDHCRERMGYKTTTHGFRATFRTWAAQETFHEDALAEKALGHLVGDEVARAYNRGNLLGKRRVLMEDWADYLSGDTSPERNPFLKHGSVVHPIVVDDLRRRKSS